MAKRPRKRSVFRKALTSALGRVDTATSAKEDFIRRFADDPDFAEVSATGSALLPLMPAHLKARVVVKNLLPDAHLHSLIHRLRNFMANPGGGTNCPSIRLVVDGIEFGVERDEALSDRQLSLALTMREDPRIMKADITVPVPTNAAASDGTVRPVEASITAAASDKLPDLFDDYAPSLEPIRAHPDNTLSVKTEDRNFRISGPADPTTGDDRWRRRGREAWVDVDKQFCVTSARITPDSLALRVENESDIDAAAALARGIVGDVQVTVSGGRISLASGANGAAARAVYHGLSRHVRDATQVVWTSPRTQNKLKITLDDVSLLPTAADQVTGVAQAGEFSTVTLAADSFEITDAAPSLPDRAGQLEEVRESGAEAGTINARNRTATAYFPELPTGDEVGRLAGALHGAVGLSGEQGRPWSITLRFGDDRDIRFRPNPGLSEDRKFRAGTAAVSVAFVRAWNRVVEGGAEAEGETEAPRERGKEGH